MKNIVILIFSLFVFSCNEKEQTLKGDLYFKLIEMPNYYGLSKEKKENFDKTLDSLRTNPELRDEDKDILFYYDRLKDANLLKSPSIKIIDDKEKITTVFLSEKEFAKLNKYSLDYLRTNHKKVALEISTKLIGDGFYYSDNIVSIKETEGETPIKK